MCWEGVQQSILGGIFWYKVKSGVFLPGGYHNFDYKPQPFNGNIELPHVIRSIFGMRQ